MTRALSHRLFVAISAAIVIAGAAAGALSYGLSFDDAYEQQDSQLRQVAAAVATQAQVAPQAPFHLHSSDERDSHFVFRLLGTPAQDDDPRLDLAFPRELPDGLKSLDRGEMHWRVMVASDAGGQRFAVAQRQTIRSEAATDSVLLTVLPMLVLVPLLLVIVRLLLNQGFARMGQLSTDVDALDDGRLTALDPRGVPSEALPLVNAVNRLVARLGLVMEQQRRMVADAAHELRTPVAAIRVQADNLGHASHDAEAHARLGALQTGLGRISELIEQLLDLARVQGRSASPDKTFRLDEEVLRALCETLPFAERRHIDLGCTRVDETLVHGDPASAYALARNAIDNAVRYSRDGGSVDVTVQARDGRAVFMVDDSGPGIAHELRGRAFEPFFRILGSSQSGSGLGLAIVRSAAQSLGGQVALADRLDAPMGMRFVYTQSLA